MPAESVPDELVSAALRAAELSGRLVGDVPVAAIAAEAGMSRSTLLRRLGGARTVLDEAVRAAGVDPGGRPVKDRALVAAAELISEIGVGMTTLEAIAGRAGCSIDSLFVTFGNRDELLGAVFARYSPIVDVSAVLQAEHDDLTATVYEVYQTVAASLTREPRITPALLAEAMARPSSAAVRSFIVHHAPQMFAMIATWLDGEIAAGRIRDLPRVVLLHQFAGPLLLHMLVRPTVAAIDLLELPDVDRTCRLLAEAFVRAIGV